MGSQQSLFVRRVLGLCPAGNQLLFQTRENNVPPQALNALLLCGQIVAGAAHIPITDFDSELRSPLCKSTAKHSLWLCFFGSVNKSVFHSSLQVAF